MTDAILMALKANFPFTLTRFGSAVSAQQPVSALIIQRGTIINLRGPEESHRRREDRDALIRGSEEKSSIPKLNFVASVRREFLRGRNCEGSLDSSAALRHHATPSMLENCCLPIIPLFVIIACFLFVFFPHWLNYHTLPTSPSHSSSLLPAGFFFSPLETCWYN